MYLSELQLSNFRQFGPEPTTVSFQSGVTALVGSNDSGKTSIVDAIRYVLTTRDQEYLRVQPDDFHYPAAGGPQAATIALRCKLSDLSTRDLGSFAEYLTYEDDGVHLYVVWSARRTGDTLAGRRWVNISVTCGVDGSGPAIDGNARQLLAAAYLRPLRDAEREMSSGKGSRLSQVLTLFPSIKDGIAFDAGSLPASASDAQKLGLSGLSEYLRHLVNSHSGVTGARDAINNEYLGELSLTGDDLRADINFVAARDEAARLRQILERLELNLLDGATGTAVGTYGLGSNNLLFMACELLLLSKEDEGLPLLLIEEPEAHLHPQRQLRLMQFLQTATTPDGGKSPVQVIVTTHSPNLASKIPLDNIVLMRGKQAFSLRKESTGLAASDYRFLQRFLDVTKANLFFARAVMVVEGEAEELLIPTIAKVLGQDLTRAGVSIVNVRGTGLRRYTRIFQRSDTNGPTLGMRVAALTDLDVMPDAAPALLGLVDDDDDPRWGGRRQWKALKDFSGQDLEDRRQKLTQSDGQGVRTFVADDWTFEYALAIAGLPKTVHSAAMYAIYDDKINDGSMTREDVRVKAKTAYAQIEEEVAGDPVLRAITIYKRFHTGQASKAIAAQYLAEILERKQVTVPDFAKKLRMLLPKYIVDAIDYVAGPA